MLLTLARMETGLPLAALGLIGCDADGDYILQMLAQHRVDSDLVRRSETAMTAMSQVMTEPGGQRTFFHAPGANRCLDLTDFDGLDSEHKIFHLGYLLLLDSLDRPDEEFGTRSARLLAQMQQRGYQTSLDLVSRQGDPRYRPLVLPALRWLDYLVINELEAGEFTGLALRAANGEVQPQLMAEAAEQLLQAAVRRRVVIHCPEGAYGVEQGGEARWQPSWRVSESEIVGSVGAGDAFCAGVLYASHEDWPLVVTLQLAHACARFNLLCANAIDGARSLPELQDYIRRQPPVG